MARVPLEAWILGAAAARIREPELSRIGMAKGPVGCSGGYCWRRKALAELAAVETRKRGERVCWLTEASRNRSWFWKKRSVGMRGSPWLVSPSLTW